MNACRHDARVPDADASRGIDMADNQGYERTPLWGWVLIIAAIAALIGVVLKALSTGAGR
jgi:hypothetical protein